MHVRALSLAGQRRAHTSGTKVHSGMGNGDQQIPRWNDQRVNAYSIHYSLHVCVKKKKKKALNKSLNFLSNVKFTPESEVVRVRGFRTVLRRLFAIYEKTLTREKYHC